VDGGGEGRPGAKTPENPWGGLPSLSGQLVSVQTTVVDNNSVEDSDNDDNSLFREDVLLGRPLHDKKINTLRNRL